MLKAILIGFQRDDNDLFEYEMEELKQLTNTLEIEVVAEMTQRGEFEYKATYLGSGKCEELKQFVQEKEANFVICNDELTSMQLSTLEEIVECEIIDRTNLILLIFEKRAKTKEAKLQVEVSKLKYQLPRLAHNTVELDQQRGGSLRNRGSGERKLERDKRVLEQKINQVEQELKELVNQRKTQRNKRLNSIIKKIAIVGYTNAGKSSLINMLLEEDSDKRVVAQNLLFSTVETKVRKISLPNKKECVLTDTVGFVSKLPHALVKAFRSTLEEVKEADLLIHVIDVSNPYFEQQRQTTYDTLNDVNVVNIPVLEVYNKIDLVNMNAQIVSNRVYLSCETGEGIDLLKSKIVEVLYQDYEEIELLLPYDKMNDVSELKRLFSYEVMENREEGIYLKVVVPNSVKEKYKQYIRE